MESFFSLDILFTFLMILLLQAVLGFDNLLYISIESRRVREDRQAFVRRIGIAIAIIARIVLLFVVLQAIKMFQSPLFSVELKGILEGEYNVHSLIVLLGGVLIIYTALKEIFHMLFLEEAENIKNMQPRSVGMAIFWIVAMNLVFSFDSILSAIALTDQIWVIALTIILSGLGMMWLADHVSEFLKKNRMYEVLGLFILFIVGIMLVSEGGHLAHMSLLGSAIEPMGKSTFYFVILILIAVDVVQSRYRKKLLKKHDVEA